MIAVKYKSAVKMQQLATYILSSKLSKNEFITIIDFISCIMQECFETELIFVSEIIFYHQIYGGQLVEKILVALFHNYVE